MQFGQHIYVNQLEYELMDIEGVRSVNYVTPTQYQDWRDPDGPATGETLPAELFKYSVAGDLMLDEEGDIETTGTDGYGWAYDFQNAFQNGIILPPSPSNPGIFELKKPNQNIKGVVR